MSWLTVFVAASPLLSLLMISQIRQNTARTDPKLPIFNYLPIFALVWNGMAWAQGTGLIFPTILSIVLVLIIPLYTFWFSKLGRKDNSD
ncbi:MAG: hypothetical protein ACI86H_003006, partial [bacterium]